MIPLAHTRMWEILSKLPLPTLAQLISRDTACHGTCKKDMVYIF